MKVIDFIKSAPNEEVQLAIVRAEKHIQLHNKIACSISGGSDSDIMLDLLHKVDSDNKVTYIFMNTGLEYEATKRHIKYLEDKYGIEIKKINATKPIPTAVKEYGYPFLSKLVSEMISRLQKRGFQWEDEPLEVLERKYHRCRRALRWWCNDFGEGSRYNISYNKWLKEFMMQNHPQIPISQECCHWAKKDGLIRYINENGFDMSCVGIRKSEGGARVGAYKNCYSEGDIGEVDQYRPIFWLTDSMKEEYENRFVIRHSDCYSVWGMKRTGCSGCPFGRDFEYELELMKKYEPKMYKAACAIFGKSYEYTRKYREFQKAMKESANENCNN